MENQSVQILKYTLGNNRVIGHITEDAKDLPSDIVIRVEGPEALTLGKHLGEIMQAEFSEHAKEWHPTWSVNTANTVASDAVPDRQLAEYRFRLHSPNTPASDAPEMSAVPLENTATRVVAHLAELQEKRSLDEAIATYKQQLGLTQAPTAAIPLTPSPEQWLERITASSGMASGRFAG